MKIHILTLLWAILLPTVLAETRLGPEKAVLVTYPSKTPDSIIEKAILALEAAGGEVTHKFVLIKYGPFRTFISLFMPPAKMLETRGFAATAPAKALEMLSSLSVDFVPWIEEDQMVTADGDLSSGVNKA
ncbi:hypothetical protein I7I51_08656 [Histoplasma capsulatum]|uniref:Inhibitor I9 domain-containing protein n=1 Tax=Ajellomyces capsulatus TaxID=5037 RepID=A0A8A1M384_AJECA|nr:predicted protein [Histoplasma mississippiense (nom. inval.)]EDN03541.1 predicted protein [Histoplasma mississippiense (nom. inval.)]QSS59223.1 hypothetical protein I7I51_08656 [Histoplasma capsulatum]